MLFVIGSCTPVSDFDDALFSKSIQGLLFFFKKKEAFKDFQSVRDHFL